MTNVSIATCFDYDIPFEKQLEMVNNAGFKYVSIGGKYSHSNVLLKEKRKEIKSLLNKFDLKIDTLHGCCTDDPECIGKLDELIEAAHELEVPIIVIHPISGFEIEKSEIESKVEEVKTVVSRFESKLKQYGIKLAIENLHPENATEVLDRVLPQLDSEYVGFCYDSSHDQVDGPRKFDLLERHLHRLIAVHLSDRIKPFVDHAIPGEGFVDFERIGELLRKSNFKSPILMELMIANSNINNHQEFLATAYSEAVKIYAQVSGAK